MQKKRFGVISSFGMLSVVAIPIGCNSIVGLDKFSMTGAADSSVQGPPEAAVSTCTNARCTAEATQAALAAGQPTDLDGKGNVPAICLRPAGAEPRCVNLMNPYCSLVTGDYLNDNAVVIGSLFAVSGPTKDQNVPRQGAAVLAVEEINDAAGGVVGATDDAPRRPLVMVSCDAQLGAIEGAQHLAIDLAVPAIVGPNTSDDTTKVSTQVTIAAHTVVISPTAIASSIGQMQDGDMTWLMIPSEEQRAPLMIQHMHELDEELRQKRSIPTAKLAIIYRNDTLGLGTYNSLKSMDWAGQPASSSPYVKTVSYEGANSPVGEASQAQVAQEVAAFAPDIVVLAGLAEAVTRILLPMEELLTKSPTKPYYIGIDPLKGPNLEQDPAAKSDELRRRIRAIGLRETLKSAPVYNSFVERFHWRYRDQSMSSGCGPSYDAVFAIAFALAAARDKPVSGTAVAYGLRRLSGGVKAIQTFRTYLNEAYTELSREGGSIAAMGTFGPLQWDQFGNPEGGRVDVWCVGLQDGGKPVFQSSGQYYDIGSNSISGKFVQCSP